MSRINAFAVAADTVIAAGPRKSNQELFREFEWMIDELHGCGDALIPEARRVSPDSLRRAAASGRRWWAIRTREGGHATGATAALMDSLARGGRRQIAMVTLWGGVPGMLDSTRAPR